MVETEIVRDGETLGTTSGTSFFDPNRTPGQSYTYELVAVNASGARSATTIVGNSAGSDDSIISVDNRDEILANLLDVFYGRVYEDVYASARFAFFGEDGRAAVGSGGTPGTGAFECEGGGGSTLSGSSENFSEEFTGSLSSCRIDGVTYNGTTEYRGRSSTFEESVSGFSARDSEVETESLTSRAETGRVTVGLARDLLSITGYESTRDQGLVRIEDASTFVGWNFNDNRIRGDFKAIVVAPWTGGEIMEVATPQEFGGQYGGVTVPRVVYTEGSLTAEAADGSTLVLDAGNGDPDSFTLTIEAQGSTSSFTVPWQQNNLLPCSVADDCRFDLPTAYPREN